MNKRIQVGQWTAWRCCRQALTVSSPKLGLGVPGVGCVRLRRSEAAPPALSLRPPLSPRAFCSPKRPVVRRGWDCPGPR